jgi:signal peptidase I
MWVFSNPFYGKRLSVSHSRYITRLSRGPRKLDVIAYRFFQGGAMGISVKRVIALPGEQIKLRRGMVYINGKPLKDNKNVTRDISDYGPVKVPADNYFVLSDNRANSADSRTMGPVPAEDVIGTVVARVIPLSKIKIF